MTSLSIDLGAIEDALIARYSGVTISIEGTPTAVEVFMEDPATEENEERVYPSISISMVTVVPAYAEAETEDFNEEQLSYDSGTTPHETVMRQKSRPYRVLYSIDTWHKVRALEERDLLKEILLKRTPPRGYLSALNIDGVSIDLDVDWSGGIQTNDEKYPDMVVYHKTVTLEVLAYLANVDSDDTRREKVVMEENWEFVSRKTLTTVDGISIVVGGEVTDTVVQFDDTTEGPV